MRSKRERLFTFVISVLAVTAFIVTSFVALVWANGLKFDPASKNFQQTAIIAVEARITDATIFVNDREIGLGSPIQVRNLPPGQYELKITKLGFQDYVKTFQLSAGEVGVVPDTVDLMAKSPRITIGQSDKIYLAVGAYEAGLAVENGELTDKKILVTRFGSDPVIVRRFNDGYLYQIGADLRLYFPDNATDTLIRSLSSAEPARLEADQQNWVVTIFEIDTSATTIYLTEPSES